MGGDAVVVTLLLACAGASLVSTHDDTGTPVEEPRPPPFWDGPTLHPPGSNTTPPLDADQDGVPDEEDCAPEDASVYPGATDWCDGVDQDCDGDPVGAGMCGEVNLLDRMDSPWWEGTQPYGGFSVQVTGHLDGVPVAISGQHGGTLGSVSYTGFGLLALVGTPEGEGVAWTSAATGAWVAGSRDVFIRQRLAGDFDGDGSEDIWWISGGQYGYWDGAAYLVRGVAEPRSDAAYIRDAADASWLQAAYDDNFAYGVDAGGDVDGDGRDDLVVNATGNIWTGTGGTLHLVLGRPEGELPSGRSIGDEVTLYRSDGGEDDWGDNVNVGPDFDGDGAQEVLYGGLEALGVIPGLEFATSDGGAIADLLRWSTEPDDRPGYLSDRGLRPGDLDGDGYEEFVLNDSWNDRETYEECVLVGAPSGEIPEGALSDIIVARACLRREHSIGIGSTLTLGDDIDDDGFGDLVFLGRKDVLDPEGWPVATEAAAILPSSRLALYGTVDVDDIALWYGFAQFTGEPEMQLSSAMLSDLDDDGAVDLVVSDSGWSSKAGESVGRVVVFPGFEIPWDDPTKW